jgi:hypothetical protein
METPRFITRSRVKYHEMLTIQRNENAGFAGLSARFTPSGGNSYDKVQRDIGIQGHGGPKEVSPSGEGVKYQLLISLDKVFSPLAETP